jgi:hypothetical protein
MRTTLVNVHLLFVCQQNGAFQTGSIILVDVVKTRFVWKKIWFIEQSILIFHPNMATQLDNIDKDFGLENQGSSIRGELQRVVVSPFASMGGGTPSVTFLIPDRVERHGKVRSETRDDESIGPSKIKGLAPDIRPGPGVFERRNQNNMPSKKKFRL